MSESTGKPGTPSTSEPTDKRSEFRLARVIRVVVPFLLIGFACYVFFGLFDGAGWLSDLIKPPLVPGTGQILLNGKPLAHGEIRTKPAASGLAGAVGFLNERGDFTLQTEIKGNRINGAYPGEHKVTVVKYGAAQGPFAPLLVPQKYASFETTPLTITVSRDSTKNEFSIALEGSPADRGRDADASLPPTENAGPDPIVLTSLVFQELDRDDDGRLSQDELEGLNEAQSEAAASADRDGDGAIRQQELYGVVRGSVDLFKEFADNGDE